MSNASASSKLLFVSVALLLYPARSHADTCVKFHKRAPVRPVCGRVINIAGDKLSGVQLTLTGDSGSVLFTTRTNRNGSFSFGTIPRGDYTLHVETPNYHVAEREIRVTRTNEEKCTQRIDVTLGLKVCDTGTRVRGIDKASDLDSPTQ